MNDNKFVLFFSKYLGAIIGIIIGIIILSYTSLYEVFKAVLVIGVCGWFGSYFQRNKEKVKDSLKKLIDKM